jgi:HJR/Mrr/RecB family endonuclease
MSHLHYICIISKDANSTDLWHFDLEKVINGHYKTYLGESFSFERSSDLSDRMKYQIDRISLNVDESKFLVRNQFIGSFELDAELHATLSAWVQEQHKNQLYLIKNKEYLIDNLIDKLIENDKEYKTGKLHRTPTVCMFTMAETDFNEKFKFKLINGVDFKFMEGIESNGTIKYGTFHNPRFSFGITKLLPCGFCKLNAEKIEEPILLDAINHRLFDASDLSIFITKHKLFSSQNKSIIRKLIEQFDSAEDMSVALSLLVDSRLNELLRDDDSFNNHLNKIKYLCERNVLDSDVHSTVDCSIKSLYLISKHLSNEAMLMPLVLRRLSDRETDPLQAIFVDLLLSRYDFLEESFAAVNFLIERASNNRIILGEGDLIKLLMLKLHRTSADYIAKIPDSESIMKSPDYVSICKIIENAKFGNETAIISRLEKLIQRKEYIKTLFLLDEAFAQFYVATPSQSLEFYIRCLGALGVQEIFELLEKVNVFSGNLKVLDLQIRENIRLGTLDFAVTLLERMKEIEPLSEITLSAQSELERHKLILKLGNNYISPEDLQSMTGIEFEILLQKRFKEMNFTVSPTRVVGDYGADIILEDNDETKYIIQCKRFSAKVNLKAVQEVVAALKHYNGDYGIVITNNQFLRSAIELALSNNIELWDGEKLQKFFAGDLSFSVLRDASISPD